MLRSTFKLALIVGILGSAYTFILPHDVLAQTSGVIFNNVTTTGSESNWGLPSSGGNRQMYGQISATPDNAGYVCSIEAQISKNNSPTDQVTLWVYGLGTTSSTNPNPDTGGSLISSSTVTITTATAEATTTFPFTNCWQAVPGSYYNLKFTRTGAYDVTNNYSVWLVSSANATKYADGLGGWAFWAPNNTAIGTRWLGYYDYNTSGYFPTSTIDFSGFTSSTVDCSSYYSELFSSSTFQVIQCYTEQTIKSGIVWAFVPNTGLTFFNAQLTNFQNTFPFVIFFQFQNIAQNAVNETVTEHSLVFPVVLPNGASSTITLLTSSSIRSFLGNTAVDTWFTFQKWTAWVLAGWGMLIIMTHRKRK